VRGREEAEKRDREEKKRMRGGEEKGERKKDI
jgi:hypothetical protein